MNSNALNCYGHYFVVLKCCSYFEQWWY